jgi:hypothetical protein
LAGDSYSSILSGSFGRVLSPTSLDRNNRNTNLLNSLRQRRQFTVPIGVGLSSATGVPLNGISDAVEYSCLLASGLEPMPKGMAWSFARVIEPN